MLKQRLITAAILIPLVVWGILSLPLPAFAALFAVVILLGAWEWSSISGVHTAAQRVGYLMALAVLLLLLWWLPAWEAKAMLPLLLSALVWWCVCLVMVLRYSAGMQLGALNKLIAGVWILAPCWAALVALRHEGVAGPAYVLFLLTLIWVADTGAYFVGKRWGKHKLAPSVSPGKTLEGFFGALVSSLLWSWLGVYWLQPDNALLFVMVCVITMCFSVLGDLVESMYKRQAGIKDSGHILPGHGGVLDRIDSLTSAAPIFALGLMLLEVRV